MFRRDRANSARIWPTATKIVRSGPTPGQFSKTSPNSANLGRSLGNNSGLFLVKSLRGCFFPGIVSAHALHISPPIPNPNLRALVLCFGSSAISRMCSQLDGLPLRYGPRGMLVLRLARAPTAQHAIRVSLQVGRTPGPGRWQRTVRAATHPIRPTMHVLVSRRWCVCVFENNACSPMSVGDSTRSTDSQDVVELWR